MSQLIDPIIPRSLVDALKDTFALQVSVPLEITKVETADAVPLPDVAIISAVGMKSPQIVGTLALCFPEKVYLNIISKMLGENYTAITSENLDGAGELLNIIYASARVKINEADHGFDLAIPTTTSGSEMKISHGGSPKVVRVTCRCEFGFFYLEVSMRRLQK